MNDIIEKNRAAIGPMLVKRIFVGQHSKFDGGPKRFIASKPSDLPKCLALCAHAYIEQIVFDAVSLDSTTVKLITDSLRQNHVHVKGMILYGVDVTCEVKLLVDLLRAAESSILFIINCKLDNELAGSLAHHKIIAEQLQSHFIGSFDCFEVYLTMSVDEVDWLTNFVQLTLPSITDHGYAVVKQFHTGRGPEYRVYRDPGHACSVDVTCQPLEKVETSNLDVNQFYILHSEQGGLYCESGSLQSYR
ncbi:unnamed protein product [Cylicocyclus nassatus]|uniref:Uncharacterized protein n=1 Tax=Cylicocyclus nassatus TaxID=53992 RepID=A0AA36GN29_CYLNA|nr:unnamed protein product [Cylicocyclus nassatus]